MCLELVLFIQTENPNPKNYICTSEFPLSHLFPSLLLCTHIYTFCCMEDTKFSKRLKAGCEKLYNIQRCFLVGNLEESKKWVKNYSLLLCCTPDRVWMICQSISFSSVISCWLQFLKYMALSSLQLNIIQFLCCHTKDCSVQSAGYFSLLWCWYHVPPLTLTNITFCIFLIIMAKLNIKEM